jgi:chemotaxis response regulator CheB
MTMLQYARAFVAILSSRLDVKVCGEAVNGREAIDKAKELNSDLIILDLTMPDKLVNLALAFPPVVPATSLPHARL